MIWTHSYQNRHLTVWDSVSSVLPRLSGHKDIKHKGRIRCGDRFHEWTSQQPEESKLWESMGITGLFLAITVGNYFFPHCKCHLLENRFSHHFWKFLFFLCLQTWVTPLDIHTIIYLWNILLLDVVLWVCFGMLPSPTRMSILLTRFSFCSSLTYSLHIE